MPMAGKQHERVGIHKHLPERPSILEVLIKQLGQDIVA